MFTLADNHVNKFQHSHDNHVGILPPIYPVNQSNMQSHGK